MKKVFLKEEKKKSVLIKHPWIFSAAIERIEHSVKPGDIVEVCDRNGKFLAKGYINPKSQITIRILTWQKDEDPEDKGFIEWHADKYTNQINKLNRLYMRALMQADTNKVFYPDANFTLRVTYGNVDTYEPKDGVEYEYFTTLKGVIEKDNPEIYDYDVPAKLKELYEKKDYGPYAENGKMHVCFTASNHTTGGNSGSPVINANGELIGVNFDRNWEGTMSDIMYDPDMCRNISLDIRYALFLIDKFAGDTRLIDEMTIVE